MEDKKHAYEEDPSLKRYFDLLPSDVKDRILDSGVEISTLGELMKVAEHFKEMT